MDPETTAAGQNPAEILADRGTATGTPTVADIYRRLRAEILHGELEAGSIISQVQLATKLGVNRTRLREALRMLQREQLVEGEYNRRARVAKLSNADLEQLYTLRIVQEGTALYLTVPILSEAELERLRFLWTAMGDASDMSFGAWELQHREFHRILVSGAGQRFAASLDDLAGYTERYRRVLTERSASSLTIGAREHLSILEACERRDAREAMTCLARHLARTALTLISISDPLYDPRGIRGALEVVAPESSFAPLEI